MLCFLLVVEGQGVHPHASGVRTTLCNFGGYADAIPDHFWVPGLVATLDEQTPFTGGNKKKQTKHRGGGAGHPLPEWILPMSGDTGPRGPVTEPPVTGLGGDFRPFLARFGHRWSESELTAP